MKEYRFQIFLSQIEKAKEVFLVGGDVYGFLP